jgi:hypothetical protein
VTRSEQIDARQPLTPSDEKAFLEIREAAAADPAVFASLDVGDPPARASSAGRA